MYPVARGSPSVNENRGEIKMDFATMIGVIAGGLLILSAGEPYQDLLINPARLLFVIGGGMIATLVAHPLAMASRFPVLLLRALFARVPDVAGLIIRVVGFAEMGRREGILALEAELRPDDDPFLAAGVRLAVDGTEPDLIMDILETAVQFIKERHAHHGRVVASFGRGCLLFGAIASLMTLSLQGGSGLSGSALLHGVGLPLLYGILVFGLMQALSHRLSIASSQEVLHKRMVIESVMSIQSGDNPRIAEHKLSVFLEPRLRPSGAPPAANRQLHPPAQADAELIAEVAGILATRTADGESPFQFADTAKLTDRSIQVALRKIDQKDLVVGLKGAPESIRAKFLGNMSQRVRVFIEEEIGFLETDAASIAETQGRIVDQLRRLAREEKIELPESDA
jgi:chemotaxis protein MotA